MPNNKLTTEQVRLSEITIADGRLPVVPSKVQSLVDSILVIGLLEPIGITKKRRLVYGRHRYEAYSRLDWETIPAVIVDLDDLRLELAEIDENIQRKQLTKLEESQALARRKEIYELLHPETKKGGGAKGSQGKPKRQNDALVSFTEDTAAATGKSKRTIERDVAKANAIPADVQKLIAGLAIANKKSVLSKLGKLPENVQREVAKHLADGGINFVPETFCSCGGFLFDEGACLGCNKPGVVDYDCDLPEVDDQPEEDRADAHAAELPPGQSRGKGVMLAHEAVDKLKRIPKNDGLRKRGFQIVTEWIKRNEAPVEDGAPGEIAAKTADELTAIGAGGHESDVVDAAEVVRDVLVEIDQPDRRLGLPIGFSSFDMEIGGLYRGELVILAARPRMGKTSLALNIAANVAASGRHVLFLSLEMSAESLARRLLSAHAGVDGNRLRTGELADDDRMALVRASNELPLDRLHLVDQSSTTVADIRWCARRLQRHGPVVPYLMRREQCRAYHAPSHPASLPGFPTRQNRQPRVSCKHSSPATYPRRWRLFS